MLWWFVGIYMLPSSGLQKYNRVTINRVTMQPCNRTTYLFIAIYLLRILLSFVIYLLYIICYYIYLILFSISFIPLLGYYKLSRTFGWQRQGTCYLHIDFMFANSYCCLFSTAITSTILSTHQEILFDYLFGQLGVMAACALNQALLALYSYKETTGIVGMFIAFLCSTG